MSNANVWDGLPSASATGSGEYFPDNGQFQVRIESASCRNGHKGFSFILEGTILWSADGRHVDTRRSWVINLSKSAEARQMGLGNIKAFLNAAFNVRADQDAAFNNALPEIIRRVTGPDNPFQGLVMNLSTHQKPMVRTPGKNFTVLSWFNAGSESPLPRVEAARALVETAAPQGFPATAPTPVLQPYAPQIPQGAIKAQDGRYYIQVPGGAWVAVT